MLMPLTWSWIDPWSNPYEVNQFFDRQFWLEGLAEQVTQVFYLQHTDFVNYNTDLQLSIPNREKVHKRSRSITYQSTGK